MEDDDPDDKACKVILLGEYGVGKKSITHRFVNGYFYEEYMIGSSTHEGYPTKRIIVDEIQGKSVKFEIWPTFGEEIYHAISRIFYKNLGIAILVYDISKKESFDQIKYWYNEIKEKAPKNISKKCK